MFGIYRKIRKYLKGRDVLVVRETSTGNLGAEGTLKEVGFGYVILGKVSGTEIVSLNSRNFVTIMDKPMEKMVTKVEPPKILTGVGKGRQCRGGEFLHCLPSGGKMMVIYLKILLYQIPLLL